VRRAPVVPGSTRLRVLKADGQAEGEWHETAEWDLVTPHERAFRLSHADGTLSFGDGQAGRVPPSGAQVFASYKTGGGEAGNVPAGSLERPLASAHNAALVPDWETARARLSVRHLFAAEGGSSAETLAAAKGRAVTSLAAPARAVTLADYEALALGVPGVPVARARALADYHPSLPCLPAPGCVTVVVVPACGGARPEPRPEMLEAVARHLRRHRTLTTELYVIGPSYARVTVHARLLAGPRADARELAARARRALDDFFHPLRGGPDGAGWPVGRDVYRAEVLALLGGLPGVSSVDSLGLEAEGDDEPRCDNLPVARHSLLAPGEHQIQVIERSYTR
jgi:predicted phage baseplate assembly protein